jgi:hypothetical protein
MKCPSIYRNLDGGWWHGGFDRCGMLDDVWMVEELWWLLWHGKFWFDWRWPKLFFGMGRTWYDGPIWYIFCGFFSVEVTVRGRP